MTRDKEMARLKRQLMRHLYEMGYRRQKGTWIPPPISNKERIRELAKPAVARKIARAREGLESHEDRLLEYIANGDEVVPTEISPRMVQVKPGTVQELLFRYGVLHWSIPVSSGYGRRLRFLVMDRSNNKLIGIIGLGDPVYNLPARDTWIGWDSSTKKQRIRSCMDAYVLGSIPPYSTLLCGKLLSMSLVCGEIRRAYNSKYRVAKSLISGRSEPSPLALVTTLSALGKSSVYSRVKMSNNRTLLFAIGTTSGTGDFHLNNSIYSDILEFVGTYYPKSGKRHEWGTGFRNRREVLGKFLGAAGMSRSILTHGIPREVYAAPTGTNSLEYLRGECGSVNFHDLSLTDLFDDFRTRWMLPRANRRGDYAEFRSSNWRIWGHASH